MKVTINRDAFAGMTQHNGAKATMETDKGTKEPLLGKSGKTKAFNLATGGRIFLRDDQYTVDD